jgi:hypothetical protein
MNPISVFLLKDGSKVKASTYKMFETHGVPMLDEQRLDNLVDVSLLFDGSTVETHSTSSGESTVNNKNMAKRAIVGGVLLGGAGAIIGGATAKQEITTKSKSVEKINANLTVKLRYSNDLEQIVILSNIDHFQYLISFVNMIPRSDNDIALDRDESINFEKEKKEKDVRRLVYSMIWKNSSDKVFFTKSKLLLIFFCFVLAFMIFDMIVGFFVWIVFSVISVVFYDFLRKKSIDHQYGSEEDRSLRKDQLFNAAVQEKNNNNDSDISSYLDEIQKIENPCCDKFDNLFFLTIAVVSAVLVLFKLII